MKVSLNWLSEHLDLSGYSVPQLSDLLTFAGVEVEGIEEKGVKSDRVVVAQIKEFVQHPNADRLSVCQVDDGSGTTRQIVCGAKNFKAGDKVPLALPGAVLPGGFEIKEGKLRGVDSMGMMCSGKELGIGEDTGGLLILGADAEVGSKFSELVPADVLFDLEITPNRPDLLSHLGLARELAALTGLPLKGVRDHARTSVTSLEASAGEIRVEVPEGCSLYTARIVKGVKVGPSPEWLCRRLESIGLRPINNVVDVTNFVLMEMGQPLHAFDLRKLKGGIVVRRAEEGEKFLPLVGGELQLAADDLVIADESGVVALAGVMGGADTGVTESTVDLLLEAAHFHPGSVRRTARRLVLNSDSSYRFERGVDAVQTLGASELAVKLILEVAGGTAEEVVRQAGAAPAVARQVTLDEARAARLLGIPDLSDEERDGVLTRLGLVKKSAASGSSVWAVPSYRGDLERSVDLVEELARVIGLDRVPVRMSAVAVPSDNVDRAYDAAMSVRQALVNRGFYEAQTLRLISQDQVADALSAQDAAAQVVPLKNPLSEDHTLLRPSLVPGLLAAAELNIRQGAHRLRLFETGRVFLKLPNGQVREDERLGILLSGPVSPSSWHGVEPAAADIYDLKGVIESLPGVAGQTSEIKRLKDDGSFLLKCEWKAGNRVIGWFGQVHPARCRSIDARHPVYVAELSLSALRQGTGAAKFEELPKFPAISRDVAMEAPADLPHAKVAGFFAGVKEPLLIHTKVFDVFSDQTGTKIAKEKKSLAYSLTYRASDRTLETAEVDAAHARILQALEKALPVSIRK